MQLRFRYKILNLIQLDDKTLTGKLLQWAIFLQFREALLLPAKFCMKHIYEYIQMHMLAPSEVSSSNPFSLQPPPHQMTQVPSHCDVSLCLPFSQGHLSLPSHIVEEEVQHMGPRTAYPGLGWVLPAMPRCQATPPRPSSTEAVAWFFWHSAGTCRRVSAWMTQYSQLLLNNQIKI